MVSNFVLLQGRVTGGGGRAQVHGVHEEGGGIPPVVPYPAHAHIVLRQDAV